MGDYSAVHIKLQLKEDAPTELIEYFNYFFNKEVEYEEQRNGFILTLLTPEELNTFESMSHCVSSYHDAYNKCLISDDLTFQSFASTKCPDSEILMSIVRKLFKYLKINDGDIVCRWVWEDHTTEYVIWVDLKNNLFVEAKGFNYSDGHGYIIEEHPWRQDEKDGVIFIPVMNWHELNKLYTIKDQNCEYYKI